MSYRPNVTTGKGSQEGIEKSYGSWDTDGWYLSKRRVKGYRVVPFTRDKEAPWPKNASDFLKNGRVVTDLQEKW